MVFFVFRAFAAPSSVSFSPLPTSAIPSFSPLTGGAVVPGRVSVACYLPITTCRSMKQLPFGWTEMRSKTRESVFLKWSTHVFLMEFHTHIVCPINASDNSHFSPQCVRKLHSQSKASFTSLNWPQCIEFQKSKRGGSISCFVRVVVLLILLFRIKLSAEIMMLCRIRYRCQT